MYTVYNIYDYNYNIKDNKMKIKCDICKKILKEPSALLFSPPTIIKKYRKAVVFQYHICAKCWSEFKNLKEG